MFQHWPNTEKVAHHFSISIKTIETPFNCIQKNTIVTKQASTLELSERILSIPCARIGSPLFPKQSADWPLWGSHGRAPASSLDDPEGFAALSLPIYVSRYLWVSVCISRWPCRRYSTFQIRSMGRPGGILGRHSNGGCLLLSAILFRSFGACAW